MVWQAVEILLSQPFTVLKSIALYSKRFTGRLCYIYTCRFHSSLNFTSCIGLNSANLNRLLEACVAFKKLMFSVLLSFEVWGIDLSC